MKSYNRFIISVGVVYILGLILLIVYFNRDSAKLYDRESVILTLNNIVYDAKEKWDSPSSISDKDYGVDFVILDKNNRVIYRSSAGNVTNDYSGAESVDTYTFSVEMAIKNHYPYAYITRNEQIIGSVILFDDGEKELKAFGNKIVTGFGVFGLVVFAAAFIYGKYVKKNIIDPFDRMSEFAGKVAEGNLDVPLLMEKNNMFGAFSESFDIMREELAASKNRELELQKKEKELVASLSHDLKTPVTGIKLSAELLKAKLVNADKDISNASEIEKTDMITKLDNIYKKAEQIDVLISDLFASTLDDLGEFKVSCRDEESKMLGNIVRKYDDKGVVRMKEIPGVVINIDTRRMNQVIGNIISNSQKYAKTAIDIDFNVIDEFLEMSIKDHGSGVPESELELITRKFYRGKDWVDSKEDGSGLGLYIAKSLMEKMGGELIVENDDGFCVKLLIPLS